MTAPLGKLMYGFIILAIAADTHSALAFDDFAPPVLVPTGSPGHDSVREIHFSVPYDAAIETWRCHAKFEGDLTPWGSGTEVSSCDNYDFIDAKFTGVTQTKSTSTGTTFSTTCRNWSKDQQRWCTIEILWHKP
jgi:hypothetical protein